MKLNTIFQNQDTIEVEEMKGKILLDQESVGFVLIDNSESESEIFLSNKVHEVVCLEKSDKNFRFNIDGTEVNIIVKNDVDVVLDKLGIDTSVSEKIDNIKAPMPGLVLSVEVKVGQSIKKGDPLLVLEAMKMENIIKSPPDTIVQQIHVNDGDNVEKNQVLLSF